MKKAHLHSVVDAKEFPHDDASNTEDIIEDYDEKKPFQQSIVEEQNDLTTENQIQETNVVGIHSGAKKYNFEVVSTGNSTKSKNYAQDTDYQSRRTIQEVVDIETGEIIQTSNFFGKVESEIINYRRILEQAVNDIMPLKFICPYCLQPLLIYGGRNTDFPYFFSHAKNSDACPIKTTIEISEEVKNAFLYRGCSESNEHRKLKGIIYNYLKKNQDKDLGVSYVDSEIHFYDKLIKNNWKKPDVIASYKDNIVVFEIQLSKIPLEIIVGRDDFYRTNDSFIIWVFGSFNTDSEWQSTMVKDIYYANNRNVFLLDEEAISRSEAINDLVLHCFWQEPFIINGEVDIAWQDEYVQLKDLDFYQKTFNVFYEDCDKKFNADAYHEKIRQWDIQKRKKYERFLEQARKTEKELQQIHQKTERFEKEEIERIQRVDNIITQLEQGELIPTPFEKVKKMGFVVNGKFIVNPTYNEADEFIDGLALVKRNRKYGYINFYGEEVIPCIYSKCYNFHENYCVVSGRNEKGRKQWYIIDRQNNIRKQLHREEMPSLKRDFEYLVTAINDEIPLIDFNNCQVYFEDEELIWSYTNKSGVITTSVDYDNTTSLTKRLTEVTKNKKVGLFDLSKMQEALPCIYDYISILREDRQFIGLESDFIIVKQSDLWGLCNQNGELVLNCQYELINYVFPREINVSKNNKFGILDDKLNIVLDVKFEQIEKEKDFYKVAVEGKWGIYDLFGKMIRECQYNKIYERDKLIWLMKDEKWGVLDTELNEILDLKFNQIKSNGLLLIVKDNDYWGCFDRSGNQVCASVYKRLNFLDNYILGMKNTKWGILDHKGVILLEFKYNFLIKSYRLGEKGETLFISKFGRKFGLLNSQGESLIEFIYDELSDYQNFYINVSGEKIYNVYRYKKGGERGYVDISGKEYQIYWKDRRDFS